MQVPSRYQGKIPLVQPRGGRSNEFSQLTLWQALAKAGADVLPLTIDSKTRLGHLQDAEDSYKKSKTTITETLNGFPLLSVPIEVACELVNSATKPVSLRHGTPYASNLVHRAIEVGIQEIEGGPLSYSLPYSRNSDLKRVVESWEKVESICRSAEGQIVRETFGILTACLVPPIQALLVNLLECLFIDANKGGTPMASFGATGSLYQDIASIETFRSIYPWFQDLMGINPGRTLVAFHHWMGPFPLQKNRALEIISTGNLIAKYTRSDKVVTKTSEEALGVPTNEANSESVELTKSMLLGAEQIIIDEQTQGFVEEEIRALTDEIKLQLISLKNSAQGISEMLLKAVSAGLIDPPFAPHQDCLKRLKSLRAPDGSVRITPDYPGIFTSKFIAHETQFLGKNRAWNSLSADEIKGDIIYPFQGEAQGI